MLHISDWIQDLLTTTLSTAASPVVGFSLSVAVAASIGATIGGVISSGAAGAAAGCAGGVAGSALAGGGVMPLMLGAQRFAASSGLGVEPSPVQLEVASSLSWTTGELPFLSSPAPPPPRDTAPPATAPLPSVRRHLSSHPSTSPDASLGSPPPLPSVLISSERTLFNLLITFGLAIALTFAVHAALIRLWRTLINHNFYAWKRAVEATDGDTVAAARALASHQRYVCCGPRGAPRKAKFYPFPKSLVWPTPLFFTCCVFATGLTRASVRLLSVQPAGCGMHCAGGQATAIATLTALTSLVIIAALDLAVFYRGSHGKLQWKPAKKLPMPSDVADPYYRAHAKAQVQAVGARIVARHSVVSAGRAAQHSFAAAVPRLRRSTRCSASCMAPGLNTRGRPEPFDRATSCTPIQRLAEPGRSP